MFYPVRTPWLFRQIYPGCIWRMPATEQAYYLTFDDGPEPEVTPWVLDQLKAAQVKATFFCIGENVRRYPRLFERILSEGHAVGNHSQHHLNGWKTKHALYCRDVQLAAGHIQSSLFRPPYGRITPAQLRTLQVDLGFRVVMWSLLSGDFDTGITPEQCLANVSGKVRGGDIITFHDSRKAAPRLTFALPVLLSQWREKGMSGKSMQN